MTPQRPPRPRSAPEGVGVVCCCSFCLALLRAIGNAERNEHARRKMLTERRDTAA